MPHPLSARIQPLRQRVLSGAAEPRRCSGMDVVLFMLEPAHREQMGLRAVESL